ncbi:lipocalin family protein [Pontiella desulfatans]|nr:lipocalin family protein [Pontiella desulfatans]
MTIMILTVSVALFGCGGDDDEGGGSDDQDWVVGSWKSTNEAQPGDNTGWYVLNTFRFGGTFTFNEFERGYMEESGSGTYKTSGDQLIVTLDGGRTMSWTILNDDTMTWVDYGVTYTARRY